MLEINIVYKKWYNVIKNPKNFVFNIIDTSLSELDVSHYQPKISIALGNDELLHQLNLKFRKVNKSTNVLSFPCEELSNRCDLGDIAISLDTIEKESNEYCIPMYQHIAHMLIHGLLHLLKYDHKTHDEEVIMKNLENKILISLGYSK